MWYYHQLPTNDEIYKWAEKIKQNAIVTENIKYDKNIENINDIKNINKAIVDKIAELKIAMENFTS